MSIAVRRSRFLSDTMIVFLQSCSRCIDFCTALSPTVELVELDDLCLRNRLPGINWGSMVEEGASGLSTLCASSAATISWNAVSLEERIKRA